MDPGPVTPEAPRLVRQLPNALSLLRLGCALALPFVPRSWWLGLVLVAGASDWLDGYTARRFHVTSWIGGLLDGLSDKAFVVSALLVFTSNGLLSWWQLPFLLLRDVSVATGVTISALRRDAEAFRHMDSRLFGKLTTVVIFALLVGELIWPEAKALQGALYTSGAILSAAAGGDYFLTRHRRVMGR